MSTQTTAAPATSEAFKARLDSAGREEVSIASSLMQGRLLQRNFVGMEDTSAFKAIQDMRGHLDELNPGKEGDLFQPQKLLSTFTLAKTVRDKHEAEMMERAGSQAQAG